MTRREKMDDRYKKYLKREIAHLEDGFGDGFFLCNYGISALFLFGSVSLFIKAGYLRKLCKEIDECDQIHSVGSLKKHLL